MVEKEAALLKGQITRLNENKFVLDAWGNQTVIFPGWISGGKSPKVKMIKDLHHDYSGQSLINATGLKKTNGLAIGTSEKILDAKIPEFVGKEGRAAMNEKLITS